MSKKDDSIDKVTSFREILEQAAPLIEEGAETNLLAVSSHASNNFASVIEQDYPELKNISQDHANEIRKYLSQVRGTGGGVRLICAGANCSYREACPLWNAKKGIVAKKDPQTGETFYEEETHAPVGKPCPLELTVVMDTRTYYESHADVDLSNPVHKSYVNELCQLAALEWRMNMLLAYDQHGMVQDIPAAISPDGKVYTKTEMNQLLEVMSKITDRRSKILRELTITPEAQYKRKVAEGGSSSDLQSKKMAEARRKVRESKVIEPPKHVLEDPDFKNKFED